MDPQVKKLMLCQDLSVFPLISNSGAGDKVYADVPTNIKGYIVGAITLHTDEAGDTVQSDQYIFVDGPIFSQIDKMSVMSLPASTVKLPILRLKPYYTLNGVLDYGVVYL